MDVCYVCEKTKLEGRNKYTEHILLNAIGGKLTASNLICQNCARKFDKMDAVLADELNWVGLWLDIPRDRGKNPSIKVVVTETNEEIYLGSGGKPIPTGKPDIINNLDSENPSLQISAKNEEELKKHLNSHKKKYPELLKKLNVEEAIKHAVPRKEEISAVAVLAKFDKPETWQSLCKMAVNFYMYKGGSRDFIKHLVTIPRNEDAHYAWYYYPNNDTAISSSGTSFLHALVLRGDPSQRILYVYIELYSTFKIVVLLSNSYDGQHLEDSYVFDVMTGKEIDKKICIKISREELLSIVKEKSLQSIEKLRLAAVNNLIMAIQIYAVSKKTVEDSLNDNEDMISLDEDMISQLSLNLYNNLVVSKLIKNPEEE